MLKNDKFLVVWIERLGLVTFDDVDAADGDDFEPRISSKHLT